MNNSMVECGFEEPVVQVRVLLCPQLKCQYDVKVAG